LPSRGLAGNFKLLLAKRAGRSESRRDLSPREPGAGPASGAAPGSGAGGPRCHADAADLPAGGGTRKRLAGRRQDPTEISGARRTGPRCPSGYGTRTVAADWSPSMSHHRGRLWDSTGTRDATSKRCHENLEQRGPLKCGGLPWHQEDGAGSGVA
jgi:hypothetical protein